MTEQEAKEVIEKINQYLDWYYNETLKKCFNGRIPEKCTFSDWFKFNRLWNESGAYTDAAAVQVCLREAGFDVKMSMTDKYKLSYHGVIV